MKDDGTEKDTIEEEEEKEEKKAEDEEQEEEEGDRPPARDEDQKAHDKAYGELRTKNAKLERELSEVNRKLGTATEDAVQEIANRITDTPEDAPPENPHDRDLEADRHAAWEREQETKRNDETVAAAKAEGEAAGRSSAQVEFAYLEGVGSEKDFLEENENLVSEDGSWSEEAWQQIGPRLMSMQGCSWDGAKWVRNSAPRGSGTNGAVTKEDIEGVVWANKNLRAEMMTENTRKAEDKFVKPRYPGGPRRPQGAAPSTKATTGEEAYDHVQAMLDDGATMKAAQEYVGTLSHELQIEFHRQVQRRG